MLCNFLIINNSPYDLYTESQTISHGEWLSLPHYKVQSFSRASFSISNSSGLEQLHGSEGLVSFIASDPLHSEFEIYCNNPYKGTKSVYISNPYPLFYSTYFTCAVSNGSLSVDYEREEELKRNKCTGEGANIDAEFYIDVVSNTKIINSNLAPSNNGFSYIKIFNDTPYTLRLLNAEAQLGYWEKELPITIDAFSFSRLGVLGPDGAVDNASKANAIYAFTSKGDAVHSSVMEIYNPGDKLNDDTCRDHIHIGGTDTDATHTQCNGISINEAYISVPPSEEFFSYYECSADGKSWTTNHCPKTSDALYVNFHLVSVGEVSNIEFIEGE